MMHEPATVASDLPIPARTTMVPGVVLAAVLLCLYGGLALTVDFPRAAIGIQSDEATYYMMGHSLAADGDLTYRREDLVRVWREFPSGPAGVFLKKGRVIERFGLMRRPPFFWTATRPDTDPNRYFYGKSFAYPLFAAPFVRVFGTNGFLVLNALLLAAAAFCGYVFLAARTRPAIAALLAGAFVMVSVVPVYFVWIAPELFNFTLGVLAYFCWLYKEVAPPGSASRRSRWLFGPRSDVAAGVLLGLATFSKVSNALLFPPVVLWLAWRRRWREALNASIAFALVALALFAINLAISGEWNYQGGQDRSTFVYEFPLQTPASGFGVGAPKERNEALTEIIFNRSVVWTNLTHNLGYLFVGRYAGMVPYYFPAAFAVLLFLAGVRRRPGWQVLALCGGLAQPLFFAVVTPYTWLGGGGSVGNRYFMGAYGAFLFLLPPISRVSVALVPWIAGSLFVAPLVLNPFVTSFYPGRYAAHGLFRLLPVELTLVYDWPINTDESRVRIWYGDNKGQGDPGFQLYFFDANAYGQEIDKSFWVKGESRAEFLVKTDRPMKRLVLTLTAGGVATDVTARVAGRTQRVALQAGGSQQIFFALGDGFPYQGQWPVWTASVSSSAGFVPALTEDKSTDTRYLGVRVKPTLVE
jgi:Dolichyl-phosphate-mannose-protein mannosyltransferase